MCKLYYFFTFLKKKVKFDLIFFREISDNLGQPVNCITLSNDGNCILASCLDSTLRLLDRLILLLLLLFSICVLSALPALLLVLFMADLLVNYCKNIEVILLRLVCRCLVLVSYT